MADGHVRNTVFGVNIVAAALHIAFLVVVFLVLFNNAEIQLTLLSQLQECW
jgi:hypothetical protein